MQIMKSIKVSVIGIGLVLAAMSDIASSTERPRDAEFCAQEGGWCRIAPRHLNVTVWYGADSSWHVKEYHPDQRLASGQLYKGAGGFPCTNREMGKDPLQGKGKACFFKFR
jgi:hypothetical protein